MKSGKVFVFALAVIFCIGSISVLANDASADMDLKKGDAYGQAFKLDMKTLEPSLKDALEYEGDFKKFLNEMIAEGITYDEDDLLYIDSLKITTLDFTVIIASLMEVVKADDSGTSIDYEMGLGVKFAVAGEMGGMLPKAGTYDASTGPGAGDVAKRNVKFSAEFVASMSVYGTMEFTPEGELKSVSVTIETFVSASISAGIAVELIYGAGSAPEKIKLDYKNTSYDASFKLKTSFKLIFTPDEPEDNYEITIKDPSATGKITMSNDLKKLIDNILNEKGFVDDNIMNMTVDGIKVFVNGELNNNLFDVYDLEKMSEDDPFIVPYFTLNKGKLFNDYGLYDAIMGSAFGDFVTALGLEDVFEGLESKELDANGVKNVKNALNDVRNMGSDGNSLLLYIAIIAVVAIVGVGAFLFIRSRKA